MKPPQGSLHRSLLRMMEEKRWERLLERLQWRMVRFRTGLSRTMPLRMTFRKPRERWSRKRLWQPMLPMPLQNLKIPEKRMRMP